MLLLVVGSFLAGILTILVPCVFPFLPVIVGGSIDSKRKWRPFVITASLVATIVLVSVMITGLAEIFDLSERSRRLISIILLLVIGFFVLFPEIWDLVSYKLGLSKVSGNAVNISSEEKASGSQIVNEILIGASLGPAFAACSPVYTVILTIALPQSFLTGLIYITAYAAGLGFIMLLVSLLGQTLIRKLRWSTNPRGWFRRSLGVFFIFMAVALYFNWDRKLSAELLQNETYYNLTESLIEFEGGIREDIIEETR